MTQTYMSRKKEGRGVANIENSINESIWRLKDYIKKSKERLITTTRNSGNNKMEEK